MVWVVRVWIMLPGLSAIKFINVAVGVFGLSITLHRITRFVCLASFCRM